MDDPASASSVSSMRGKGYLFLTVILLSMRQSQQTLKPPFFLATNMTAAPYGEVLGVMRPLARRSCMYSLQTASSAGLTLLLRLNGGLWPGSSRMVWPMPLSGGRPGGSPSLNTVVN